MQVERLAIETGGHTVTLVLHPRLTVVAGAGRLEREALVNELIGSLGAGRSGIHVEVCTTSGSRLAVFRPEGDRHRVVDVERAADVTSSYASGDGTIDLLADSGLTAADARRAMRLRGADLAAASREEEVIAALAHADQDRLWQLAEDVLESERELEQAAENAGGTAADAGLIEQLEARHSEHERAQEEHERVRRASFIVGATAGLLILPIAALSNSLIAVLPLVLVAIASTAASIRYWRRFETARRAELETLDELGSDSYATYQIERVKQLVATAREQRSTTRAAERHRAAVAQWELLAGEVPVTWALDHRARIRDTAHQLRASHVVRGPIGISLQASEGSAGQLAPQLLARLASLRKLGTGAETLPLIVDDAFAEVPGETKAVLLEALVSASSEQQVIYLTDDDEVTDWARIEAMTGALSIIEPTGDAADGDSQDQGRSITA